MAQYLTFFSVENLYDFLASGIPGTGFENASCDDLRKKAEEKRKKEFNRNDAISTAGQRLCGYCEASFKDTRSKAVYDSYLLHTRTKTLLDKIKSQYNISGKLSEDLSEKFVVDLAEVLKERKLATDVLVAFCEVERIPYTLPRSSSSSVSPSGGSPAGSSPTGGSLPRNSSTESSSSSSSETRSSSTGNSPSSGFPSRSSSTVYVILILAAFILAIIFLAPLMNDDDRYSGTEQTSTQVANPTLQITEKVVKQEDLATIESLNKIASTFYNHGLFAEAEPQYEMALEIAENALAPEDPNIATLLNNLANTLDRQRRYSEAEPLYKRALEIREKVLGSGHPDTALSLNNLADNLDRQRRYSEAEPLYRRALEIREKILGPKEPLTVVTFNNLVSNLNNQGKHSEAEELLERYRK
jgi:Flp pilus assembly protein TadD